MSTIRANKLKSLDGTVTRNVETLVDDVNAAIVTTSTGDQEMSVALDSRVIRTSSIADMEALTGLTVGQEVSPGNAGLYRWDGTNFVPKFNQTITVSSPTDYPSYQAAIDALSNFKPSQGVQVDLVGETGWVPEEGISVQHGDYSYFLISHADAEVTLTSAFTSTDFLYANRAQAPTLNCLINADGNCSNGYNIENGSYGAANPGCGVKNANIHGLRVYYSSQFDGQSSVWDGGGRTGATDGGSCVTFWASTGNVRQCSAINSGYYGIQAAAASILDARSAVATGAARHGLRATNGALAVFRDCVAQNCGVVGLYALQGSTIDAMGADVSGADQRGVQATLASTINFENGIADNVGSGTPGTSGEYGMYAFRGSRINARSASFQNCTGEFIVWADGSSEINADGANYSGGDTVNGIYASACSTINTPLATFDNSTCSSFAVYCLRNSRINAEAASMAGVTSGFVVQCADASTALIRNMTGAQTSSGIRVQRGSFISADGNAYTASQTVNSLTSDGAIFR